MRAPDEIYWGLPVWRYGPYEIVGDTDQLQFVVMRGSVVAGVFTSLEDAERFLRGKRKGGTR